MQIAFTFPPVRALVSFEPGVDLSGQLLQTSHHRTPHLMSFPDHTACSGYRVKQAFKADRRTWQF